MSKPFSIQSPEDIAMEYGGNKRKIAQAMQLGVVDPTAGVLAGMFIDRMRAAQLQEQAPQATVAQQVMGGAPPVPPTAPSGGLGATPQAAPPMAPAQGGMPPEAAMAPPQGAPVGMAEGGMVPPYAAGGGLSDAPIPDGMFDEPSNGGFGDGYAGGGLVAFGPGGEVSFEEDFDATFGKKGQPEELSYYGYSLDPRKNMDIAREMMGIPESKYSGMLEKDLLETLDPAAMEKRRKGRMWGALADIGFRLAASSNPDFFGALGEAGMGALPAAQQAKQLEKSDQRYARKALADLEAGRNTQRAQIAAQALQMQQMAIQGYEAETGRKFQASEKDKDRNLDLLITNIRERGDTVRAGMRSSGGDGDGTGRGTTVTANRYSELQEKYLGATKDFNAAKAAWIRMGRPREDDKNPGRAAAARAYMDAADLRRDAADMWNNARLRGAPAPAKVNKRTAVKNGQILTFDEKGNLIP